MRLERYSDHVTVVLSRRNLLSLLSKLDGHPHGSACTIIGGAGAIGLIVMAEEDDEHYKNPVRGAAMGLPGPMPPATEDAIEGR